MKIFLKSELNSLNKNLGILSFSFWITYLNMFYSFCDENKSKNAVDVNKDRTYCEFFYEKTQELGVYCYNNPGEATLWVLGGCIVIGAATFVICSSNGGGSGGGAPIGGLQTDSASDFVENKIAETIAETVINYISSSSSEASQKLAADTSEKIVTSISEAVQTDPNVFDNMPLNVCGEVIDLLIAQNLVQSAVQLVMALAGCWVYAVGQTGYISGIFLERGTSPTVNLDTFKNWYKTLTNGGFTPKKIVLEPLEPSKPPVVNPFAKFFEMLNSPEFKFRLEYIDRFLPDLTFEGNQVSLDVEIIKKYTLSRNYLEYNFQSSEVKSMVDLILSEKASLFVSHNDTNVDRNQVVATMNILSELKMCFGKNSTLISKNVLNLGNNIFGSQFFEHSYDPDKDYWNINQKKTCKK
jgi:hypothetical protein